MPETFTLEDLNTKIKANFRRIKFLEERLSTILSKIENLAKDSMDSIKQSELKANHIYARMHTLQQDLVTLSKDINNVKRKLYALSSTKDTAEIEEFLNIFDFDSFVSRDEAVNLVREILIKKGIIKNV
jgi:regulator of replication initiation timing